MKNKKSPDDLHSKYMEGLTKTYGFYKGYQYKGKKCNNNCKNLIHYETIHDKKCPFYNGSFSQQFDEMLEALKIAREEIIELTDSDMNDNNVYYPTYIDNILKKVKPR